MSDAPGNYLTTKQAAEILGVTLGRVHHFIQEGRLPLACRQGRIRFLDPRIVRRFAKVKRKHGRPKKEF